jgi:hypothetical protein
MGNEVKLQTEYSPMQGGSNQPASEAKKSEHVPVNRKSER